MNGKHLMGFQSETSVIKSVIALRGCRSGEHAVWQNMSIYMYFLLCNRTLTKPSLQGKATVENKSLFYFCDFVIFLL